MYKVTIRNFAVFAAFFLLMPFVFLSFVGLIAHDIPGFSSKIKYIFYTTDPVLATNTTLSPSGVTIEPDQPLESLIQAHDILVFSSDFLGIVLPDKEGFTNDLGQVSFKDGRSIKFEFALLDNEGLVYPLEITGYGGNKLILRVGSKVRKEVKEGVTEPSTGKYEGQRIEFQKLTIKSSEDFGVEKIVWSMHLPGALGAPPVLVLRNLFGQITDLLGME